MVMGVKLVAKPCYVEGYAFNSYPLLLSFLLFLLLLPAHRVHVPKYYNGFGFRV